MFKVTLPLSQVGYTHFAEAILRSSSGSDRDSSSLRASIASRLFPSPVRVLLGFRKGWVKVPRSLERLTKALEESDKAVESKKLPCFHLVQRTR